MPDPTVEPVAAAPAPSTTVVTVSAMSAPASAAGRTTVDGHTVEVRLVQPLTIIGVRALRVFLQTLLGLLLAAGAAGAVGATNVIPASDFLHLFAKCAGLSLAPAIVAILQNLVELLGKVDQKYPSLTA